MTEAYGTSCSFLTRVSRISFHFRVREVGEGGLGRVKGFPVSPPLRKLCMMMFVL